MRQQLIIVLFISFAFPQFFTKTKRICNYKVNENHSNNKIIDSSPFDRWDSSVSIGFLSEKIPVSGFEKSVLYNVNKYSEFYVAFGSMLFASGVGSGFKYYFEDKSTPSTFISLGSHVSHLGTIDSQGMTIYGTNISLGKKTAYNGNLYNVGVSFMLLGDNSFGAIPFINLERRRF